MEVIHQPEARKWISKKIHVESYFDKLRSETEEFLQQSNSSDTCNLNRMIGIKGKTPSEAARILKQIEEATDLELLTPSPEEDAEDKKSYQEYERESYAHDKLNFRRYSTLPIPEKGPQNLKTLYYQNIYLEKCKGDPRLEQRRKNVSKSHNTLWFETRPEDPKKLNQQLFHKEILVVVRIYRPLKYDTARLVLSDQPKYVQEFYLLGRNKLSELRDSIKCTLDYSVSQDLSDNPKKNAKMGKELYKSGFFFINDCFYNDMRWPDCIDYSKVITDWANQPGRKFGKFSTAKMEDTLIKDLEIRLGYPYVYVHHGEHEHLVSFVDARLLSANDPQEVSMYPYVRSVGYRHGKHCMICSISIAKWITTDNDRLPEDPFYLCDNCFYNFNYDEHDMKIGNFKAYKYVDDNAL